MHLFCLFPKSDKINHIGRKIKTSKTKNRKRDDRRKKISTKFGRQWTINN